ncbi:MAG TPA: putative glycoside hydrolase, partial [Gemmatimonadaceae bacterium]|nr:putative glycoside hydrolase [Gemmatimonadaceae bacterium]
MALAQTASSTPAVGFRPSSVDSAVQHVPIPDTLRGLYVSRWAALGRKFNDLIAVANRTEINALVIDVKDDRGFVLYHSSVPLARSIGADTADGHVLSHSKLRARLDTMIAHNIYPIARIVVAKDPILARKRLDLAIKRKQDLKPWLDKKGNPWLDPHHPEVWQYAADLAREAYDLGFSEVQFDYVRFPDEKRLVDETVYPLAHGRTRDEVIHEQLGFLRDELKPLGMRVTADVFGFTATDTTEMGIGQRWEKFIDQVDVILPMVYPS